MAQRIKGQEVEVILIQNGEVVDAITAVQSFDITWQQETTSEGYLGETTNRKDAIFNGISGSMEIHIENQQVFDFIQAIVDKARRRRPGLQVNLKATLRFPNGDRPRVLVPNIEFGEIPLSFGSRSDYGAVTLSYEGSQARVV